MRLGLFSVMWYVRSSWPAVAGQLLFPQWHK